MTAAAAPIEVALRREDVLHFLGYPPRRRPAARIEALLAETLAEARRLAAARGAFVRLEAAASVEVGLPTIDADGLVLGLVTAGAPIEERIAELTDEGRTTRALLLDAAGSAVVEEAADRLGAAIVGGGAGAGVERVSCRQSPGYGRWPLEAQPALFERLPHAAVGVALTDSFLMVPRKSVSFAMWLGARERPAVGLAGCPDCALERCLYRRTDR